MNSDTSPMREIIRALTRKRDDKPYQLRVQERCFDIITEPKMWAAITTIGDRLHKAGAVSGEGAEEVLTAHGAPRLYGGGIEGSAATAFP
jgi:hypothetical protein